MALQPRSQSDSLARAGDHRPADPASLLLSSSVLLETFGRKKNVSDRALRVGRPVLDEEVGRSLCCWNMRSCFITRCWVWMVYAFVLEETLKTIQKINNKKG